MIRSLRLENFRRHEKTDIDFSPESQIVAITGRNGAGKTTVLEALTFALYGETRHGRKGIAGLVRRGAEHEGMGVVCEFTVGGTGYRVERRWEKGKHSAALYANNTLHTQTADGVTGAITALLGMDSVGFKLATIAKQKELDGLAEMTPAIRRKTVARLLRLDAVQAAVLSAREVHKDAKAAAHTLTGAANVTDRTADLQQARQAHDEALAAHTEALAVVHDLDARIGASSDVDDAYRAAELAASRAEAARDAADAEHRRSLAARAAHRVPAEVPMPATSLADLTAELAAVNDVISRGRAQDALAKQLTASTQRAADTRTRLTELTGQRDDLADDPQALAGAQAAESRLVEELADARRDLDARVTDVAKATALAEDTAAKLAGLEEVGATCDTCGQDVNDEHKERTEATWRETLTQAQQTAESARAAEGDARARIRDLSEHLERARAQVADLVRRQQAHTALVDRITEGERALAVYDSEVARLTEQVEDIDLDAAYAGKTRLEAEKAEAENAAHAALVREAALAKAADLDAAVHAAKERLDVAQVAFAAAAPDSELVAAFTARQDLIAARAAEREFADALAAEVAGAQARMDAAAKALADTEKIAETIAAHRTRAEVAAKTATVLEMVSRRLATQVRPQLEGQISALLQAMSEGRFTGVKVSDDYEVTVCDHDGKYYTVAEFSGGEQDLIALAIRLALAQVVAARHGAGGAGFLILDEVFGSQDEGRRFAILEALRRLRGTYGQILLISHVGGIEDAADMVLEVGKDDDDDVARMAVVAG